MRPTKRNPHHYAVLRKQHGGTLIGIIIGLVIGLGIALAVALMITKTPIPFTDKSGRATRIEANTSQPFDPNKPLYTHRGAGRQAQTPETKQVDRNPPTNTAVQPPSKPAPAAEAPKAGQTAPGAPAAGKDPIAAIAGAESKPAEAAEEKFLYYLQAGAFADQADAEAMRGKLALAGVEAKTSERNSESGVMYRVRVGPFNNLDALNKVRGKVSEAGVDAAVLRVAK
jgi:cell division protein FtsN